MYALSVFALQIKSTHKIKRSNLDTGNSKKAHYAGDIYLQFPCFTPEFYSQDCFILLWISKTYVTFSDWFVGLPSLYRFWQHILQVNISAVHSSRQVLNFETQGFFPNHSLTFTTPTHVLILCTLANSRAEEYNSTGAGTFNCYKENKTSTILLLALETPEEQQPTKTMGFSKAPEKTPLWNLPSLCIQAVSFLRAVSF